MKKSKHVGGWIFLAGVILAVLFGIIITFTSEFGTLDQQTSQIVIIALVLLGLIIGLINIDSKEVGSFLLSGVIMIIVATFGQGVFANLPLLQNIIWALMTIFIPAVIIVAIKNVFVLARD